MIKALAKYLLLFNIILLSGYGQLSARNHKERSNHCSKKIIQDTKHASSDFEQKDDPCIVKASTPADSKNERQEVCVAEKEIEEDEVTSSKKSLERSSVSLSNFYALSQECFSLYIKNSLTFFKRFSYFTSYIWYILFQVIRI